MKKRGRMRQRLTDWQKAFESYPEMIKPVSWSDRMPELLHISIALVEFDFVRVRTDFHAIADYVRSRHSTNPPFHFNLSHTIRLMKTDETILPVILKTSFKEAFHQIIGLYGDHIDLPLTFPINANPLLMMRGYKQILNGRSDGAILCKYIMLQYDSRPYPDPFDKMAWNDPKIILQHKSDVMAMFPPTIGQSENLDLKFCFDIWMFNRFRMPPILKRDPAPDDDKEYADMNIEKLFVAFKKLYLNFKEVNLPAAFNPYLAEILMGFAARVSNLTIETVEQVKQHKGELAELLFRTILESCIVGSWLLKRKDPELIKRFRDYTPGREKFFGERLMKEAVDNPIMKSRAEKIVTDAILEAGVNAVDVAAEHGSVFELNISQIADEVWGPNNMHYFLYKRTSEVIHGNWQPMKKYHLAKSANPMHNGAYWYNENDHKSAGLIPAFTTLGIATKFLETILRDIDHPATKKQATQLLKLHNRINKQWMVYYNTVVSPVETVKQKSRTAQ